MERPTRLSVVGYWHFDIRIACGAFWKWGGWVRVKGYGPYIERDHPVYFSERHGLLKVLRIGRWSFQWLTA